MGNVKKCRNEPEIELRCTMVNFCTDLISFVTVISARVGNSSTTHLLLDTCRPDLHLFPLAARSTAWVCGSWISETAGSNPTERMDVRLLCLLCW